MKKLLKSICALSLIGLILMPPLNIMAYDYDFSQGYVDHKIEKIDGDFVANKTTFYQGEKITTDDFSFNGYVIIDGVKYESSSVQVYDNIRIPRAEYLTSDYPATYITFHVYNSEGIPIADIDKDIRTFNLTILKIPLYYSDEGKEIVLTKFNHYLDKEDRFWVDTLLDNKIVNANGELVDGRSSFTTDGKFAGYIQYGLNKIDYIFKPFDDGKYIEELKGTINVFRLPESKYIKSTSTTIYYSDTKNDKNKVLQYKLDDGKWTSKSKFTGLKPNTKHTLSIRVKKTKDHAASKVIKVTIQTKKK